MDSASSGSSSSTRRESDVLPAPEGEDMTSIRPRRRFGSGITWSSIVRQHSRRGAHRRRCRPGLASSPMTDPNQARARHGHVLITGASSGIGAALALAYAGPGVRLALFGRDEGRMREVARSLPRRGRPGRRDPRRRHRRRGDGDRGHAGRRRPPARPRHRQCRRLRRHARRWPRHRAICSPSMSWASSTRSSRCCPASPGAGAARSP